MNKDDLNESEDETEKPETYNLSGRDRALIAAAIQLLEKITRATFLRPAELVSVAKALHALRLLPRVTDAELAVRISLTGPRRWFGEHEIYHWWGVEISGVSIQIYSGGHFYRESTGGDSFTALQWNAEPRLDPEYLNYLKHLQIVDDAKPFHLEVADLDLTEPGFTLEVEDQDNPLLDEIEAQDEEVESGDSRAGAANPPLTEAEQHLVRLADEDEGKRRGLFNENLPLLCDICGCDLSEQMFFIDGRLRGSMMWACLCAECFQEKGEGIGWGTGQLYKRQPDGEWLIVDGFPPEDAQ